MLIGATRCGVICENTVLLETQVPCGSVRRCRDDTVTDDTRAQVKGVTLTPKEGALATEPPPPRQEGQPWWWCCCLLFETLSDACVCTHHTQTLS